MKFPFSADVQLLDFPMLHAALENLEEPGDEATAVMQCSSRNSAMALNT